MIGYLKKKYLLSDKGARDLKMSILTSTLSNLSFMLPMIIAFVFLKFAIDKFFGNRLFFDIKSNQLLFTVFIVFVFIYIIALIDYDKCFVRIYDESARSRINLAEKLKKLPLSYFSKKDIADLSATFMSDVTIFEGVFSTSIPKVYAGLISIFIVFILLLAVEYRLALSLFWVIPFAFLLFLSSKKQSKKLFKEGFDLNREVVDSFHECLMLISEIKAYNRESFFLDDLKMKYDRENNYKHKLELIMNSVLNISFTLLKLGMATVAIYGAFLFTSGSVDLFTYLTFIIISGVVFNPVITVLSDMTTMMYLDSIIERIREINDMPSQDGSIEFNPSSYDIVFENVKFSYDDDTSVLDGVSFTAKQGEVTALVGPSGSGKTTAARLVARFWDIQAGKITVGGIDVSTIEPETLLKEFSIVFQDVSLFNSSIMENIRLGKADATDEEVKAVAKLANCDEFIEKLPEGYDTLIGENGAKLSGGERQRISIARALLKDAPIILLDESTASLDVENESKVKEGISKLIKDKTVIIIAHRMRTVLGADNIVVLKDGMVVENGKPNTLIEKGGVFKTMCDAQYS